MKRELTKNMKKIIFLLPGILIAVFLLFFIFGKSDEYTAEKLFYRAMKVREKIVTNPDVALPAMFQSVEGSLREILKKYPKTATAKAAGLALAENFVAAKKYDKAINELNIVIGVKDQPVTLLTSAYFMKGTVYEKMGQWENALKQYEILREKYPKTSTGMRIPLYIGSYYSKKGKEAEAKKAYRDAAGFYEKLEKDNRGKLVGYAAASLLMQAYLNLEEFELAGKVAEDAMTNYPYDESYMQHLPYIELIYVSTLKNPQKALEIYKNIREKTKNKKLLNLLNIRIKKLSGQNQD